MNHVAATKSVSKAETAVLSSATHSLEIDTLGFEYASIDVLFSPFTAASPPTTAATVLRVAQSDTSGSGQANLLVAGTDFTVGAGSTATSSVGYSHRFDLDLRGKRRYLTVYATPSSTCGVVTSCRLGKGEAGPMDATGKNVNTQAVG
jgi:hypothetical protein